MKKSFLAIAVLFFGVTLMGCGKQPIDKSVAPAQEQAQAPVEPVKELSQWLNEDDITCTIITASGIVTMKTKGGQVRMEGIPYIDPTTAQTSSGYSIMTGDWVYFWAGTSGMKYDLSQFERLPEPNQNGAPTPGQRVDEWERENVEYECAPGGVIDADFAPPMEVEFTDLTKMFTAAADMIKAADTTPVAPGEAPVGIPGDGNGGIDVEALKAQAEALEKQYGASE